MEVGRNAVDAPLARSKLAKPPVRAETDTVFTISKGVDPWSDEVPFNWW